MPRRRYRLFMLCSVVICFMLYRVWFNSWDEPPARTPVHHSDLHQGSQLGSQEPADIPQRPPLRPQEDEPVIEEPPLSNPEIEKPLVAIGGDDEKPATNQDNDVKLPDSEPSTEQAVGNSDGAVEAGTGVVLPDEPLINQGSDTLTGPPAQASKVHWVQPIEHFPVPLESIIPLPTGQASKIPQIQYSFTAESRAAKAKRQKRQAAVKDALTRSWSAYRKYAWLHDELKPVSGTSEDPFCGWAATLVDSLDTLWIAGMKDEFDEAAKAVAQIDFTYSENSRIPVFETTIRYLGGLVAAFDVSGGHGGAYGILLEKAIELADVLMGIFDTPNRLPVLFYHWKPDVAAVPKRASRVGIAEFATLSMEFTRLAQLTGKNKYYDAVDRITNALVKLQETGTPIPGLFPENLDASGCNYTATALRNEANKLAAQPQSEATDLLDAPKDVSVNPGPQLGTITESRLEANDGTSTLSKRAVGGGWNVLGAASEPKLDDCVPQDLAINQYGSQSYHMGGGQDSAYEYFPKQWLLLGGREKKYQKLHEDTIKAINEWLLFRPMLKGDWDVLFPAKVSTSGNPDQDLNPTFEVAHLTCFIGGMYGLGGRIFDREEDVEMAKKLTDGCVWAYQMMPAGVMPEGSEVVACPSLDRCEYNETLWHESLDVMKERRILEIANWEANQKLLQENGPAMVEQREAGEVAETPTASVHIGKRQADDDSEIPESLRKKIDQLRKENEDAEAAVQHAAPAHVASADSGDQTTGFEEPPSIPPALPPTRTLSQPDLSEKPMTHEEYVADKISKLKLQPGFTSINHANYILRPEAIESVFYMYRITGDPEWMEKGWTMFEATIRATKTALANSAIRSVLDAEPEPDDKMESFWIAETLKYYYLLFSDPDVISLDEWVLNTEAHPFRRPQEVRV